MNTLQLDQPPRFLTHHLLLRPDCLVRLTLPTHFSREDANRIRALLNALALDDTDVDSTDADQWPYDINAPIDDADDPDGDLNVNEIQASEDALQSK